MKEKFVYEGIEHILQVNNNPRKFKKSIQNVNVKIKLIEKFKIKLIEFYQFF